MAEKYISIGRKGGSLFLEFLALFFSLSGLAGAIVQASSRTIISVPLSLITSTTLMYTVAEMQIAGPFLFTFCFHRLAAVLWQAKVQVPVRAGQGGGCFAMIWLLK